MPKVIAIEHATDLGRARALEREHARRQGAVFCRICARTEYEVDANLQELPELSPATALADGDGGICVLKRDGTVACASAQAMDGHGSRCTEQWSTWTPPPQPSDAFLRPR